jgi:hypothetical protein
MAFIQAGRHGVEQDRRAEFSGFVRKPLFELVAVKNDPGVTNRLLDAERVVDMERASAYFPRHPRLLRFKKPGEFAEVSGCLPASDGDANGAFTVDNADAHPAARKFHARVQPGDAPAHHNCVKGLHRPSPVLRLIAETGQNATQLPQSTHSPEISLELSRTWMAMTGHTEEHPAQNVQMDWSMYNPAIEFSEGAFF